MSDANKEAVSLEAEPGHYLERQHICEFVHVTFGRAPLPKNEPSSVLFKSLMLSQTEGDNLAKQACRL